MSFCILYKTICIVLKENIKEIELKIRDMVWYNRFFISFNNMNFYEHTQDQYLHNKRQQLNYIVGYICLIDTGVDRQNLDGDAESKAVSSN